MGDTNNITSPPSNNPGANPNEKKKYIYLPSILGMPPTSHYSENHRRNIFPVLEITPKIPAVQTGQSAFTLKDAWESKDQDNPGYLALLRAHGYDLSELPLKIAFQADTFPTDSFTNEYSESFLDKMTDVVSSTAGDISQMFGVKSASDAANNISKSLQGAGGVAGSIGDMIGKASEGMNAFSSSLAKGQYGSLGTTLQKVGGASDKLLAGARVDFPQIWRNSGFSPSYSINVRLYNPYPASKEAMHKYIVGPIAAIACLGLPTTTDGFAYSWPLLHSIKCRGFFELKSAFISNISIIKGGDSQQVAYSQRIGMVDVRIDFGSLYNSMLAGTNYMGTEYPTLKSYLENMLDYRDIYDPSVPSPSENEGKYSKNTAKKAQTNSPTPTGNVTPAIQLKGADGKTVNKTIQPMSAMGGPSANSVNIVATPEDRGDSGYDSPDTNRSDSSSKKLYEVLAKQSNTII